MSDYVDQIESVLNVDRPKSRLTFAPPYFLVEVTPSNDIEVQRKSGSPPLRFDSQKEAMDAAMDLVSVNPKLTLYICRATMRVRHPSIMESPPNA